MQVTYNADFLKALNEFTVINDRMSLAKNDDTLEIKAGDVDHLILYHLVSPLENFNIPETIAFFDYSRFYNKFSMFENPKLDVEGGMLTCKSGTRVATHNLAATDVIVDAFNKVNIPSKDVKFVLSAEMIKNFKDLCSSSYFDSNRLTFDFNENPFYECRSTKHTNTFKDDMEGIERLTEEQFDITIDAKVLSMLPSSSYEVEVSSAGIMELNMQRTDNVSVKLYIGAVRED